MEHYQQLFNLAFTALMFLLGWFVRIAYDATLAMKRDLLELERQMTLHYVRKEDYKDDIREIKNMISSLLDELKGKVDKRE